MINFTVGPVQTDDSILSIGAEQVPYFRTPEFSKLIFETEELILKFSAAPLGSKVVFITGSGSAGMEASIMNTLNKSDKALIVNGGSFGERFVELLKLHEISYTEIKLQYGKPLDYKTLSQYENEGYTTFLINKHETSTGVHYDMEMISDFCKRNHLFLIVDCISSFLADSFNMGELQADIMITGSQKALACAPGIAILVLSPKAIDRVFSTKCKCQYLDLQIALKNAERGQTPWTPAVSILKQIHYRLLEIENKGGVKYEISRVANLAQYFRNQINDLPFEIFTEFLSNAVTPIHPTTQSAFKIFQKIKDEYGMWICPNGGELKDSVFRVGHIGSLTIEDYDKLIAAFKDLQEKQFI